MLRQNFNEIPKWGVNRGKETWKEVEEAFSYSLLVMNLTANTIKILH